MHSGALLVIAFVCLFRSTCATQCEHAENDDARCPQITLDDSMEPAGTALLQSKQQVLVKTSPADSGSESKRHTALKSVVYTQAEQQVAVEEDGVAVIVPGLGSEVRAVTVERNIQWLRRQGVPFECWIFVYKTEQQFPLDAMRFTPCVIVRHTGFWLSHMLELPLNMTSKPYVLHMEESSEAQDDMNLKEMMEIMKANHLGHAAPTFDEKRFPLAWNSCCGKRYPVMVKQENVKVGRLVDFIEFHIDLFTRPYFACLQDNIDMSLPPGHLHGWGVDLLLPALCGGSVHGSEVHAGRVGVIDTMTMIKKHRGSYARVEAQIGYFAFLGKHPGTPFPTMLSLGELQAP